ncbi:hypothetical protein [Porcipelethomonas sp.]|uniref:hypothetical protein n=1 Tax=Porcipelethomonas sp. TaxID=2981675 RepID=UPI003EF4BA45
MKILNKTISAGLAVLILIPAVLPVSVSAETSADKEEVIYIMTGADGSVNSSYAVNIFGSGDITDYGKYESVKMLNTNDAITVDGDKITFSTQAEKAYMQGNLKETEIPWNISIRYFLDGKELSPEETAGKSGSLEIKFKISKNNKCKTKFYDNYALQASFTLDTELCSNIKADGATIANVGSDKQLSYTILPGKGINASITADVRDFEMDAVSINGVKMNLNIEYDDSQITEKVSELSDGVEKIDEGAKSVSDGSDQLKDGGTSLKSGSSQLYYGTESLDSGVEKLLSGIYTLQSGLDELNAQSDTLTSGSGQVKSALAQIQNALDSVSSDTESVKKLAAASGQIKTAISDLKSGAEQLQGSLGYAQYKAAMSANGLDIDSLAAGNTQAIDNLYAQIAQLNDTISQIQGIPGYEEQAAQLQAQVDQLYQIIQLLNGNNGAIAGTEQYLNGLSDGVSELVSGLDQLEASYDEFDKSIGTLAETLSTMLVNVSMLSDGIDALTVQYNTLDGGICDYTSGVDKIAQGYSELTDGVSDLASGSKALVEGSDVLDNGVAELYDGISELCSGAGELSDGTGELKDKTSGMDKEIEKEIDNVISSMQGSDSEITSFVSEKNTDVHSVQFVIKTDAIEIPEYEPEEEPEEEKLSFWQKTLHLFGID